MYVSNSELRARARETLGTQIFDKKWLYAIASAVIVSAILSAVSGMSLGIGTVLLTGPLYVGFHKLFLSLVRHGDEAKIGETFEGCYDFGSNLVLGIMHSLIISLWSFLFVIPGTPKDLFTYAIGLTNMSIPLYIALTTAARFPSVILSTLSGDAVGTKNYTMAIVFIIITAVVSGVGLLIYRSILKRRRKK